MIYVLISALKVNMGTHDNSINIVLCNKPTFFIITRENESGRENCSHQQALRRATIALTWVIREDIICISCWTSLLRHDDSVKERIEERTVAFCMCGVSQCCCCCCSPSQFDGLSDVLNTIWTCIISFNGHYTLQHRHLRVDDQCTSFFVVVVEEWFCCCCFIIIIYLENKC